jgi:hypothetical protein
MDDSTLGGYLAKHSRPPAFRGPDGRSYSVAVMVEDEPDAEGRYGAALLFVQWSVAGDAPAGHAETGYLVRCATRDEAERRVHELSLYDVKAYLDRAVAERAETPEW